MFFGVPDILKNLLSAPASLVGPDGVNQLGVNLRYNYPRKIAALKCFLDEEPALDWPESKAGKYMLCHN